MNKRLSYLTLIFTAWALGLAGSASGALVAHWPFDNSPNDQVGTLHWTLNGGATYATDRKEGSHSLLCDGVDDYAGLPAAGFMTAAFTAKTVMLWFKPNTTSGTQIIFDEGGQNNGLGIRINNGLLETSFRASNVASILSTPLANTSWTHVAVSFDSGACKLYLNGIEVGSATATFTSVGGHNNAAGLGVRNNGGVFGNTVTGDYYGGLIDDVRIYDHAVPAAEIQDICGNKALAANVSPTDGATDVLQDAALSWTAGEFAQTHDVYLGTTFVDVNSAGRADAKGVLASQGQAPTTFDPPGLLAYGQTYYWRIDEVNKAPDNTIFKGDVWSFTVESYGLPVTPIAATASSAQADMGPEKTIDGSGLTRDLHGTEPTAMWLSTGIQPNWIQYEFDQVYKLHEMQVWNSNQLVEAFLGFGAKTVTVETSTDGTTWAPVANVPEFARAPGMADYAANTTVSLGVEARFVKLTITANWGGVAPSVGLSEVRFFYVPTQARSPQPATAATDVSVDTILDWRPGREATSHQVYFGTDPNAVAQGAAAAQTVTDHRFTPAPLNLGTTYYWKVDEVGAASTYPGEVWSFTTQEYKVVEDFESYTDQPGEEIYNTWVDGFDDPAKNGAVVGLGTAVNGTFAETTILHSGKQSMPLAYDNTKAPLSETTITFVPAQDWTVSGIKSLSLWFQGVAGNGGKLYVKINGTKVLYGGDPADLARVAWTVWNIDLAQAGNVKSVRSLTLGIEGTGAKGTLYFDDLRLYPQVPQYVSPVAPAAAGLQAQYLFDGNANDSSGTGRHGTVQGGATFAAGQAGQALSLDGIDDSVTVAGYKGILADPNTGQHAFTISAWIKTTANGEIVAWGTAVGGQRLNFRVDTVLRVEHGSGNMRGTNGPSLLDDQWHHVAVTVPEAGTIADVRLYVDGRDVSAPASATVAFHLTANVDVTLGAGGSQTGRFYQGLIDDVRLYDRVLSAGEIAGMAGLTVPYDQAFSF